MSTLLDDLPKYSNNLLNLNNGNRLIFPASKYTKLSLKTSDELNHSHQVVVNTCNLTLRNFTKKLNGKQKVQSSATTSSSILSASSLPSAHMASTSELRISEVQQVRSSSVGLKNNTGTSTKSTIDGNYHRLMGVVPKRSLSTSTSTNPVDSKYLINKETNVSEVTSGLRRSLSEASPNTSDSIHPKRLKIMQTIVSNVNSDNTRNMKRINPAMMYLPKQVSLSEAVLGGGSGIVRKSSC